MYFTLLSNRNLLVLRNSEHWSRLTKRNMWNLVPKKTTTITNTPPLSKRIKPNPKN